MAMIVERNGRRRISFYLPDGRRPSLHLGKISKRNAEGVRDRIEELLACRLSGRAMEPALAAWVAELPDRIASKLEAWELIAPRPERPDLALEEYLTAYVARREDVTQRTHVNWQQTIRSLVDFFGAKRSIASISEGDAGDFARWLRTPKARGLGKGGAGLSEATARKRGANARQFFGDAVARELIPRNPFAVLKGSAGANKSREHFITREVAERVLAACPNQEWRLLFALARYGALRVPSEALLLTWGDFNWERNLFRVTAPKTERYGRGERWLPIFRELRPYIDAAWDVAEKGQEYVITRTRDSSANLRTGLRRIIMQAGETAWPRTWQNLRSSRATEMVAEYGPHLAAVWCGHSQLIAAKHYWQVRDEDIARAAGAAHHSARAALPSSDHVPPAVPLADERPQESRVPLVFRELSVGPPGFEPGTKGL